MMSSYALAGYRFDNGLKVQLDVLNLFNDRTQSIESITATCFVDQ